MMKAIEIPKSLIEETIARIREAILSGELPLGSKLSEQRLADMLGVSRSPVAQALAILKTEGLVEIYPKRGSYVYLPDARDVSEMCEYRSILETAALTLSLERQKAGLLSSLRGAMQAMETALQAKDLKAYSQHDMAFHLAFLAHCENRRLEAAYARTISSVIGVRTHVFLSGSSHSERSMAEHRQIFAACEAGKAVDACRLLKAHIHRLDEDFGASLGGADSIG
ncbi:GntR family transcriptional regulator [Rhizobium sp. FY34]|uniref:GntR family transcriptional regulator n=1 Tax=Rhizobium sp. FY34 TaxID=2562309 RepID=UPI0014850FC5|nr:GntR family transcriptional regulator [Rhizobium sp. FY34]